MPKPILLSVDDDSDVLRAIERDLRSQYGAEYRVIGSDSPESALQLLKQLKVRNDSVALLLADQRMPRMDGVAFLQEATQIFPDAKRALLTAYADTNAAISAINQASIPPFRESAFSAPGGLPARMNCAIFSRAIASRTSGSTLNFPPMTRRQSVSSMLLAPRPVAFRSCSFLTERNFWRVCLPTLRKESACELAPKPISTTWQL